MKFLGLAFSFIALSAPALAQSRPDTRGMTCVQARAIVQSRGAVILSTSDTTYDRYVSTQLSCEKGQQLNPAYERTLDYQACHIGYTCYDPASRGR